VNEACTTFRGSSSRGHSKATTKGAGPSKIPLPRRRRAAHSAKNAKTGILMDNSERSQYRERCRCQTLNWAMGRAVHNRIDDECCLDFSCCVPDMFEQDAAKRWAAYHRQFGNVN
jgi:hypothetical protein